jgi:hypothetical protein
VYRDQQKQKMLDLGARRMATLRPALRRLTTSPESPSRGPPNVHYLFPALFAFNAR